jgi:hypothetical protein
MHFQCAGRMPVARLHDRTPGCPCNMYSYTSNQVTRRIKIRVVGGMSTPRADWLLGLPLTIFRGMWLVFQSLNPHYHTLRPYQNLTTQTGYHLNHDTSQNSRPSSL